MTNVTVFCATLSAANTFYCNVFAAVLKDCFFNKKSYTLKMHFKSKQRNLWTTVWWPQRIRLVYGKTMVWYGVCVSSFLFVVYTRNTYGQHRWNVWGFVLFFLVAIVFFFLKQSFQNNSNMQAGTMIVLQEVITSQTQSMSTSKSSMQI